MKFRIQDCLRVVFCDYCWTKDKQSNRTRKINESKNKLQYYVKQTEEPMSRSMPTTLYSCPFVFIVLFLDRISREWHSRGSAMTNHKKLMTSLNRNCLSFTQSVKMPWHRPNLSHFPSHRLLPDGILHLFPWRKCARENFWNVILSLISDGLM